MATTTSKRGGRRPGAGRKPMREEAELHRLVTEVIPYETRAAILKAVIAKAVQGDLRAAHIALAYACGRPAAAMPATTGPETVPIDNDRKNDQFAHDLVTGYGDSAFPEGTEGANDQPPDPNYVRAIAAALDAPEPTFPIPNPEAQPAE